MTEAARPETKLQIRIVPVTPLRHYPSLDQAVGAGVTVYVKHENHLPTGAFKEVALRGFSAERTRKTFRTSGTSTERRGELHLDTLALYEASLLPSFRRGVLPDLPVSARARMRVLAPSPTELPDSSLRAVRPRRQSS